MIKKLRLMLIGCMVLAGALTLPGAAFAANATSHGVTQLPNPDPIPGSYGIEATKPQPPPTVGATVNVPASGASFSDSPVTVSGVCPDDSLLVQIYDNDTMVGSVMCQNHTFSIPITLFTGQNDISAVVYDDLGQAGPTSNVMSVNYNNTNFAAFGTLITLTSNFGRRAADPGTLLSWPLLLSGGQGPYAFSVDWGDGTAPSLQSQSLAGTVTISHTYSKSGIYHVVVRVSDANGVTAFLQLTAVSNGNVTTTSSNTKETASKNNSVTKVLWLPAAVLLILLIPTYWLGRHSELVILRHKLEKDSVAYEEEEAKLEAGGGPKPSDT